MSRSFSSRAENTLPNNCYNQKINPPRNTKMLPNYKTPFIRRDSCFSSTQEKLPSLNSLLSLSKLERSTESSGFNSTFSSASQSPTPNPEFKKALCFTSPFSDSLEMILNPSKRKKRNNQNSINRFPILLCFLLMVFLESLLLYFYLISLQNSGNCVFHNMKFEKKTFITLSFINIAWFILVLLK
ncbi:hypothetical protein TRFO_05743 [Tritrichomonas foetus]|uniref:Uncharacterized protein n=1 Tax=Tritrichomonas foetus TaxID=1144522 RepID=A0A1J4K3Q7_9EUKA|nr:hypothetical protein TRFO_05743 [Tritrichomonas foetus]|eukprot:OHT06081.1 hypothetical protein TRFO_05743 [Tritrichomonas foetus]